jgi:hypothetical protein
MMQTKFKTVRIKAGESWAVVLTTQEGYDHQISGFQTADEARSWAERETGQGVSGMIPN